MNVERRAEAILGYGISDKEGARVYRVLDGIIYTDLFEGAVPTGYRRGFNGRQDTDYFNELYVDKRLRGKVELDLAWGSKTFNLEIKGLLDWLALNAGLDTSNAGVKSKRIEDFSITNGTAEEQQDDINVAISNEYGFYIRRPLIINVGEQRDAGRYF